MLGHAPLMKSNSLSNEPWKTHIIGNPKKAARNGKLTVVFETDELKRNHMISRQASGPRPAAEEFDFWEETVGLKTPQWTWTSTWS
uniref:Uncharacterized protein n=1 Tax=Parascaris equorum TaxID=6256 RepID=A0A914RN53_PAREQ